MFWFWFGFDLLKCEKALISFFSNISHPFIHSRKSSSKTNLVAPTWANCDNFLTFKIHFQNKCNHSGHSSTFKLTINRNSITHTGYSDYPTLANRSGGAVLAWLVSLSYNRDFIAPWTLISVLKFQHVPGLDHSWGWVTNTQHYNTDYTGPCQDLFKFFGDTPRAPAYWGRHATLIQCFL